MWRLLQCDFLNFIATKFFIFSEVHQISDTLDISDASSELINTLKASSAVNNLNFSYQRKRAGRGGVWKRSREKDIHLCSTCRDRSPPTLWYNHFWTGAVLQVRTVVPWLGCVCVVGLWCRCQVFNIRLSAGQHEELCDSDCQGSAVELHPDGGEQRLTASFSTVSGWRQKMLL